MAERIAIVGAGAVGAYAGGHFARDGEDVVLIDPWPEHVERMRAEGLRLEGLTDAECFTVAVRALHLTEVQGLAREAPIDIAFVCVKSYDTAWATTLVRDYLSPGGFVVSLQNCMNEETIAGVVGWGRTLGCIASKISVGLEAPGRVRRLVPKGGEAHTVFRVGEVHGRTTPRVERVAGMVARIDSTRVTSNLWGERWSKLVQNAMGNGVCAASGLGSNDCAREPVTRRLSIRLAGEAVRVGLAHGFVLESMAGFEAGRWLAALEGEAAALEAIEAALVRATHGRSDAFRPSMGQDVEKGRRTEIDHINGLVVAKAREVGIEVPANEGLVAAVKRVERGEVEPSLENVAGI